MVAWSSPRVWRPLTALDLGDVWLVAQACVEAAYREFYAAPCDSRDAIVAVVRRVRRAEASEGIARRAAGFAAVRELAARKAAS